MLSGDLCAGGQAALREMLSILTVPPMAPSPRASGGAARDAAPPPAPASSSGAPSGPAAAGPSPGERERETLNESPGQRKAFPLLDAAFMLKLPVPTAARPLQK